MPTRKHPVKPLLNLLRESRMIDREKKQKEDPLKPNSILKSSFTMNSNFLLVLNMLNYQIYSNL
jgi:hypothetical protein